MIKYFPWKTSYVSIWGGVTVNESRLRDVWTNYINICVQDGRKLPDKIRREVSYFNSVTHLFEHNTTAVVNNEEIDGIEVVINPDNEDNINLNTNMTQTDSINLDDDDIFLVWNEENDWLSNSYVYEKEPSEYVNEFKTLFKPHDKKKTGIIKSNKFKDAFSKFAKDTGLKLTSTEI